MAAAGVPLQAGADSLVTKHLYYDDTELFSCTGTVVAQYELKEESKSGARDDQQQHTLVLDETVMHPQGGIDYVSYNTNCRELYLSLITYMLHCLPNKDRISAETKLLVPPPGEN